MSLMLITITMSTIPSNRGSRPFVDLMATPKHAYLEGNKSRNRRAGEIKIDKLLSLEKRNKH